MTTVCANCTIVFDNRRLYLNHFPCKCSGGLPRVACSLRGKAVVKRHMRRHQGSNRCRTEKLRKTRHTHYESGTDSEFELKLEPESEESGSENGHDSTLIVAPRWQQGNSHAFMDRVSTATRCIEQSGEKLRSTTQTLITEVRAVRTRVDHIWEQAENVDRMNNTIETRVHGMVARLNHVSTSLETVATNLAGGIDDMVAQINNDLRKAMRNQLECMATTIKNELVSSLNKQIVDTTTHLLDRYLVQRTSLENSPQNTECGICFEHTPATEAKWCPAQTRQCRRRFHKICLDRWLFNHPKCPFCRNERVQNGRVDPAVRTNLYIRLNEIVAVDGIVDLSTSPRERV